MSIDKALRNPAEVYNVPDQVLQDGTLTREQKLKILKIWEYDARELEVAEEENMAGGSPSILRDVRRARMALKGENVTEHKVTTKQG